MPPVSAHPEYEYDAFISYRHIHRDSRIAKRLHAALEIYRTPGYLYRKELVLHILPLFDGGKDRLVAGGGSLRCLTMRLFREV